MCERIIMRDAERSRWLSYSQPLEIVEAHRAADVVPALERVEYLVRHDGVHAAGFVGYEAAAGFDAAMRTHAAGELPLLSFGLFAAPSIRTSLEAPQCSGAMAAHWQVMTGKAEYVRDIARIREQIAEGNTYQVNYTLRAVAASVPDAWQLFLAIASDAPYATFLECGRFAIVSASPELFFQLEDERLTCRPMKGTAKRGLTPLQDRQRRSQLLESTKDRAENVMIADMIRNDLGRIATPGSVVADELFSLEKYRTVWQMTSTVSAHTAATVTEIFGALFPCASVTGAPKISSMNFIRALEDTPRQVYTGAIGCLEPGCRARFSVAIRTALVDTTTHTASYGMGGGIVWNSRADDEFEECLAKARILHRPVPPADFELLETLLWTRDEGFFLLDGHLRRLQAAADYFDFDLKRTAVLRTLQECVVRAASPRQRVRLLLSRDGSPRASADGMPATAGGQSMRLKLAAQPIDDDDPFIYHKTSWRACYAAALAERGACDDVLLWNSKGYITETPIANVAIRVENRLLTPPVDCGLLAGTYREWLLDRHELVERRIHKSEITGHTDLVLFNSVRGCFSGCLTPVEKVSTVSVS